MNGFSVLHGELTLFGFYGLRGKKRVFKETNTLLFLTFQSGSYDLNPEQMETFKGKNTSRYSYLVQGHENPYFLPGDERKN